MNWKRFLKALGMAAAAGGATAAMQTIPNVVPTPIAQPVVAAIAAVFAYFMPPPQK
jgi:hypothetical protein